MTSWSPDRAPSPHHLHAPIRRQDAAWRKKDPRTGNERERLTPGQVRPRRLFLRTFPIGSQSGLAQACRLRPIRFENRDEHARPWRQRKRLFRSDVAFLVDFGFNSWKHGVKSTMLRRHEWECEHQWHSRVVCHTTPNKSSAVCSPSTRVRAATPRRGRCRCAGVGRP